MAIEHARPGEVVDLRRIGPKSADARTTALVKTEHLEAIVLVVAKGHEIAPHRVEGEITVQCLEGQVDFTAGGTTHRLEAGHWLFLSGGESHSLVGVEDAAVLLTILLRGRSG